MGILSFLKKEKIKNENTSKPFHANTNNIERKDWFSRTRSWHKVDPKIIDELIKIYDDNPMFEVFVIASMENNLVKEYAELSTKGIESNVAYTFIAGILYKHGANASAQVGDIVNGGNVNEKILAKVYDNAINLLESTVILDSNYVDAFVNLAALRGMMNADDDALKYVRQGLEAINNLNKSNLPFHKSNDENIRNTQQHLDATEKLLLDMERDFVPQEDKLLLDIISMFEKEGWSKEASEKGAFLAVNALSEDKAPETATDWAAKQLTNDQLEEVIILVKAYQRMMEGNENDRKLEESKEKEEDWMIRLWEWADANDFDDEEIPREKEQLIELSTLDLGNINLSELPKEIWHLTNLTELSLFRNNLRELPKEIGQLSQLTKLILGNNSLNSLPEEIWQLTELRELNLGDNNFSELPKEIGQLTQLEVLRLTGNKQLKKLPKEIGQLSQLTTLHLGNSNFSELPKEIWQLTKLTLLFLGRNKLTKLSEEIGQLTQLTSLYLSSNNLNELPKEIRQLTQLKDLYISANNLSEPQKTYWQEKFKGTNCNIHL